MPKLAIRNVTADQTLLRINVETDVQTGNPDNPVYFIQCVFQASEINSWLSTNKDKDVFCFLVEKLKSAYASLVAAHEIKLQIEEKPLEW